MTSSFPNPGAPNSDTLHALEAKGLWRQGQPLRLHLGCGEQRLDGYIGIDFPPGEHNVMKVQADFFADVGRLHFPPGSVDEVRSHHMFEHFSRVSALALLLRWHTWLRPGGRVHIETPDLLGSARTLASSAPLRVKMGVVRHLAGDQADAWAYHVDHWFPERFEHTLGRLGFGGIEVRTSSWSNEPFLSNVDVIATKDRDLSPDDLLARADELLEESTVGPGERRTWEVWRQQLRDVLLGGQGGPQLANTTPVRARPVESVVEQLAAVLGVSATPGPMPDLNQQARDRWVAAKARSVPGGARVLDVGAGTCPYRPLFAHCDYKTHDFKRYEGVKLGGTAEYGQIDYASDISGIPVADESFDVVLCTEVLEHVPEPIAAIRELTRILKTGGRLLLTAPLGSGLHQLPYHFYGGYTPAWYQYVAARYGLDVVEISPNGGFFRLLAQETARVAWRLPQHRHLHGNHVAVIERLFGEVLPHFLAALDDKCFLDEFTAGYQVELVKPASGRRTTVGVLFSRDRPLQLDATLRSFFLHARDPGSVRLNVLYTTSSADVELAYGTVASEYPGVTFVRETRFKDDVMALLDGAQEILFLVDDNIFVAPFSVRDASAALLAHRDALGFSFRLGRNTTYCYMLDKQQRLPDFDEGPGGVLRFSWCDADHDFGYPLELSSSLYRAADLREVLAEVAFSNPSTLEAGLARRASLFSKSRPTLLCGATSATFCAPVNRVQTTFVLNRAGADAGHTAPALLERYQRGDRLDVASYAGFVPRACHEEVELRFAGQATLASPTVPGDAFDSYENRLAAAERTFSGGQHVEAIALIEEFLKRSPDHSVAKNDLAVMLHAAGRSDEALTLLREVIARSPALTQARKNLGAVLLACGEPQAALRALEPALLSNPRDAETLLLLGDVSRALGRPGDARQFFESVLAIDQGNQEARTALTDLGGGGSAGQPR